MKKLYLPLLILFVVFFVSCNKEESPKTQSSVSDLTFIAYIIADNSLSDNAEPNIEDMEKGVSSLGFGVSVAVFVDDRTSTPKLLDLKKNPDGSVSRNILREYEETNAVDPDFMTQVFNDIRTLFPSKEYALDLWSHGMAWIPENSPRKISSKWFGQDNSDYMDIKDLVTTLERTNMHFDFIMFDACMMSSVEVMYEMRNVADYIIASPIEVWEMGFPYENIIKSLQYDDRHIRVAKAYSDFYNGQYSEEYAMEMTGAISVVDCSKLETLALATRNLFEEYRPELNQSLRNNVICYDRWTYHFIYDMGDYMDQLVGKDNSASWHQALDDVMVYDYATPTFGDQWNGLIELVPERYTGLGIYIPEESYDKWNEYYKTLQWYRDTEFLPIY